MSWESIGSVTPKVEGTIAALLSFYQLQIFRPGSIPKAAYLIHLAFDHWHLHFVKKVALEC